MTDIAGPLALLPLLTITTVLKSNVWLRSVTIEKTIPNLPRDMPKMKSAQLKYPRERTKNTNPQIETNETAGGINR